MHVYFRKAATIISIAFMLTACERVQPVYDVENPISASAQHKLTQEQVGTIIIQAAITNGWLVEKVKPGELRATIKWEDHSAVSSIHYSKTSYDILLVSSDNLKQGDGKIHKKYNKRVKALEDQINKKLSLAAL